MTRTDVAQALLPAGSRLISTRRAHLKARDVQTEPHP